MQLINIDHNKKARYKDRLSEELKIIREMGYADYFLIVSDFIDWAKKSGIPVGPGRGSGAGSLVAYALGITQLDPIKHSLLFERFLNPERISLPDFDIDFCMLGRDRVIEYVVDKYDSSGIKKETDRARCSDTGTKANHFLVAMDFSTYTCFSCKKLNFHAF